MKKLALALILILLSAVPMWGQVHGATGFDKTALDATFVVYGQWDIPKTGERVQPFLCSAFAFQKDATGYFLLTAGHCAEGPADATFVVADDLGSPMQNVTVISARREDAEDYMLLHLQTSKVYPVLELGDESSESVGDVEIIPNLSFGLGKQISRAVIALGLISQPANECPCVGDLLLHGFMGQGGSGSPVISSRTHKVIGIFTLTFSTDGFGVEPISMVKAAMKKPDEFKKIHQAENVMDMLHKMLKDEE